MTEKTMDGYQVDLDETRHVWVGRLDTDFMIQFKNAEGALTRLKLSREAGEALGYLLRDSVPDPGEMVKSIFRVMSIVKGEAKPETGWVQVKSETAPSPS